MAVPRHFLVAVAATLLCGLVAVTWIARSSSHSRVALLSVSGVEKVQHLDNQLSNRLADAELAKWDKLEDEMFPSDSYPVVHLKHGKGNAANHKPASLFSSGSGSRSTDVRFLKQHKTVQKAQTPAKPQQVAASAASAAKPQVATAEEPAKAKAPAVARKPAPSLFSAGSGSRSTDARFKHAAKASPHAVHHTAKSHGKSKLTMTPVGGTAFPDVPAQEEPAAPEEPAAAEEEPAEETSSRLGDEVVDLPVHAGEDEGDIHVPAESINRYMFNKQKKGQNSLAQRIVKAIRAAVAKQQVAKQQKLGFIGEGPWAHVKEGDAHHPNGGGGDYFGRGSTLKKDGGEDGQGGIIVDRWAWEPAAQLAVNGRKPPCTAACSDPKGCPGHTALADGDCDEIILRDHDLDRSPEKEAPATYDAYTGNTHGLFKDHKVQTLHAQNRQAKGAARPYGLASLARPQAVANRPPGLGIFAPTAAAQAMKAAPLAHFEELATVLEKPDKYPGRGGVETESHAGVHSGGFLLHPSVVEAINATNGTALGDDIVGLPVDGPLDVSFPADKLQPYMFKAKRGQALLHASTQVRHVKPRLGDEVLDGFDDDNKVVRRPSASARGLSPAGMEWVGKGGQKLSAHAMFVAAARGEAPSDGLADEEVPRSEAAAAPRSSESWDKFFAAQHTRRAAAAAAAARAASAQPRLRAARGGQQLLTVGEHAAANRAVNTDAAATSSTVTVKCTGNGSICGDETVDWLKDESVHVHRGDEHRDPKELDIYNYFGARKAPAGGDDAAAGGAARKAARHIFKDHDGLHHGLSDRAALEDMNKIFDSMPGGMPTSAV